MVEPALVTLEGISRSFTIGDRRLTVREGVSFDVRSGEFVALTGPSGSGKSTLMHLIGFLDRPTSGHYHFAGRDVTAASEHALVHLRRFAVGFVFQQFHLLPRLTARENVEVPLTYQGVPAAERSRRAVDALRRVGLAERTQHRPNELSGGEQQRVAIARAVVTNPRLLLADEPTGNLDSRSGGEILELLRGLHREGRTVIVVTHDEGIATSLPRRVRLKDGKVVSTP